MSRKKDVSLQIELLPRGQDAEFRINSKREMQFILQEIAEKGTRVALYYDEAHNFILTTLYGANEVGMWLDIGPFPPENKRILLSDKITFVSVHQHVKVQFEAHNIEMVLLEGDETFYLELPDYLLRIQRRNFFRLSIPAGTPVMCIIPIKPFNPDKPKEPEILREVPVVDISGGGIALLCGEHENELRPGRTFKDCRISLPGAGTISVNIEVKNNIKFTTPNELVNTRAGCLFGRMDNQTNSLLQSYITRLQSDLLVKGVGDAP